jgi:hypothetical protein
MDFEEIQHMWRQQPESDTGDDQVRIHQALKQARVLERRVAARDMVELVTAVGVSAVFVWIATLAPVVWPWVAAALVTMAVGAAFVRERLRRPPATPVRTNVRLGLQQALDEIDHQVQMLGSVAWWYLAPLFVVALLICAGTLLGVKADVGPEVWARTRVGFVGVFALVIPVVGGVFWFVWRLNERAVKVNLLPQRAHLAALMAKLEEPVAADDTGNEEM